MKKQTALLLSTLVLFGAVSVQPAQAFKLFHKKAKPAVVAPVKKETPVAAVKSDAKKVETAVKKEVKKVEVKKPEVKPAVAPAKPVAKAPVKAPVKK